MKKGIHPKYQDMVMVCACGNTVHTKSTMEKIHVEICSQCHPYYTGKQKLVDSAGMVDRFKKRYAKTTSEKKADQVEQADEVKETEQANSDNSQADTKQDQGSSE